MLVVPKISNLRLCGLSFGIHNPVSCFKTPCGSELKGGGVFLCKKMRRGKDAMDGPVRRPFSPLFLFIAQKTCIFIVLFSFAFVFLDTSCFSLFSFTFILFASNLLLFVHNNPPPIYSCTVIPPCVAKRKKQKKKEDKKKRDVSLEPFFFVRIISRNKKNLPPNWFLLVMNDCVWCGGRTITTLLLFVFLSN